MALKSKISGGGKLELALKTISANVSKAQSVKVGFLANATYPDGKSVAMIAAIQNFGAPAAGIPPRPFFSNMIASKGPEWPAALGNLLVDNNYDAELTLDQVGFAIEGQLRESIQQTNEPALAPSTIARKGSAKPLVDSGHMLNSIDHEVEKKV